MIQENVDDGRGDDIDGDDDDGDDDDVDDDEEDDEDAKRCRMLVMTSTWWF